MVRTYVFLFVLNDKYLIFVHFIWYSSLLFPPMFSLSPLDICRWYALDMISHQISLDSEAIPYETSVAVRNIGIHWRLKTGPEVRVTKSIFTIYLIRFSIELKHKKPPWFCRCKNQVHLIEKKIKYLIQMFLKFNLTRLLIISHHFFQISAIRHIKRQAIGFTTDHSLSSPTKSESKVYWSPIKRPYLYQHKRHQQKETEKTQRKHIGIYIYIYICHVDKHDGQTAALSSITPSLYAREMLV